MIKKTLTIIISLSIIILFVSCLKTGKPIKGSILLVKQSYIAYITHDDNVFFIDLNGNI